MWAKEKNPSYDEVTLYRACQAIRQAEEYRAIISIQYLL